MDELKTMKFSELLDTYLDLRNQDAATYEQGYKAHGRRLDELRAALDAKIEGMSAPAAGDAGQPMRTLADLKSALEQVTTHSALIALNDQVETRFLAGELDMSAHEWEDWTLWVGCRASMVESSAPAMTFEAFSATLSATERPVFDQKVGGWIVISRPDLGAFPKSEADALTALARDKGIVLTN